MNWTSDSIDQIAPALLKAQIAMKGAKKDSVNPGLKNKYADLASVFEACKGPLNDAGIVIVQGMAVSEGKSAMSTMLLHESGQYITALAFLPDIDPNRGINAAQAMGSAISYMRRYQLSAMAGVLQEDDDGNAAGSAQPETAEQARRRLEDEEEQINKYNILKADAEKNTKHVNNLENWYKKHKTEIDALPKKLSADIKAHVGVLKSQLEKPEEAEADPTLADDYEPGKGE